MKVGNFIYFYGMLSFIGDFTCKADSKFRVVVPAPLRRVMTASQQAMFVLRRNIYAPCIDMYPLSEWESMAAGLQARLSPFDRQHARFMRELFRGTSEVEMDANGRILLPKRLLEEIGADKEMVLAGQGSRIEIWEAQAYAREALKGDEFAGLTQWIFEDNAKK